MVGLGETGTILLPSIYVVNSNLAPEMSSCKVILRCEEIELGNGGTLRCGADSGVAPLGLGADVEGAQVREGDPPESRHLSFFQ